MTYQSNTVRRLLGWSLIAVLLVACETTAPPAPTTIVVTVTPTAITGEPEAEMLTLTSNAFTEEGPIPAQFTCNGDGTSPMLQWTGVPEATARFALIVEDPDAPQAPFVHWLVYDIPADVTTLEAAVPNEPQTGGFSQGQTSASDLGYTPPCPPAGEEHRYVFTLYALDEELGLEPGASVEMLREAMEGHVLAEAQLVGRYSRTG